MSFRTMLVNVIPNRKPPKTYAQGGAVRNLGLGSQRDSK